MMRKFFGKADEPAPRKSAVGGVSRTAVVLMQEPTLQNHAHHAKTVHFETANDLPAYERLLSAMGERFTLSEGLRDKLAVIGLSETLAMILVSKEAHGKHDFASLYTNVHREFPQVEVATTTTAVLLALYNKASKSITHARHQQKDRDEREQALSITLFNRYMAEAEVKNASDVHFVIRDDHRVDSAAIIFRIDGSLHLQAKIPAINTYQAVGVAYTKLAEPTSRSTPTFNPRTAQNCSVSTLLNGKHYKLRYQTVPASGGMDVVVRLLPTDDDDDKKSRRTLGELGYSEVQQKQLSLAARIKIGAIIIAGVTGSGKSTTLKVLMTTIPHRERYKQYSVEDPVEYKMFGVTQISVQRDTNDKDSSQAFTASLRVVLRADPDILMVGEIRDTETCSLFKTFIQTGHQGLTTVHASSAIDIPQRLTSSELQLPRDTLGSKNFISALVYQRLIPTLCPHCKVSMSKADWVSDDFRQILRNKFGLDPETMFVTHPEGCDFCDHRGSKGVTVAAEIVVPDKTLRRLLREADDITAEEYWRHTRTAPFTDPDTTGKTALEHALYKAHIGQVDPLVVEEYFEPLEMYEVYDLRRRKEDHDVVVPCDK